MNGVPTNPIIISKGVRQGASSSPTCFNFIHNRLARDIVGSDACIELPGGLRVGLLLYADDIVLIASHAAGLKKLIAITECWLNKYSLAVNVEKSQLMVIGTGSRPKILLQGNELKHTKEYRYLGLKRRAKPVKVAEQRDKILKLELAWKLT